MDNQSKFYAVEFAGFFHITNGPYYEDDDILNSDHVGYEKAKEYAELIAKLLNEYYDTF